MPKFISALGFVLLWFSLFSSASIFAQEDISLGIANYLHVQGEDIVDGHIVSLTEAGYFLSQTPYDPTVVGIVATNPALSLEVVNGSNPTVPVVTSGNIEMNVSSINGNIKNGDLITSSEMPGVGMKATKSGYIIGTALRDYNSNDPKAVGKVLISLNLHYSYSSTNVPSSLKDLFGLSILATYESPSAVFKYVVAGAIIILSCLLGFLSFGRTANTGVEALSRNPLAGRMIQMGIIFNVLVTIAIVSAGFGLAYVIIRL